MSMRLTPVAKQNSFLALDIPFSEPVADTHAFGVFKAMLPPSTVLFHRMLFMTVDSRGKLAGRSSVFINCSYFHDSSSPVGLCSKVWARECGHSGVRSRFDDYWEG